MNLDDTIVAIATPAGRGGIGVIRLSGPEAKAVTAPMLRLKHDLEPGRALFGELIEPRGADTPVRENVASHFSPGEAVSSSATRLDEVVVTWFAAPHSYTTDDVIEISAHGSPVVLRHIVELCLARGARLAEPGEFTMRAFLNGRLDLTQAEAVRDLIDSQTLYQAKVAAQQLEGALSHRLQPIKKRLVELIATLEAGIDFAEDDISVLPAEQISHRIAAIRGPLQDLAASFAYGKIVHEGLTLAIVGRPNVGKSSLFNRLVEHERAIVTATPGTTRDLVTETVSLGGIPVKLVDTAGIRSALDEAESIGIQKSREALADADLVLIVLDASQPISSEDDDLLQQAAQRSAIVVQNKSDLKSQSNLKNNSDKNSLQKSCHSEERSDEESAVPSHASMLPTSALTGEGVPQLREAILHHVTGSASQSESGFLTSARHQSLVTNALHALDAAQTAVANQIPHEMLLLDLYNVLRPLDEITGATTTDDILNLIFSTFCIGK